MHLSPSRYELMRYRAKQTFEFHCKLDRQSAAEADTESREAMLSVTDYLKEN